MRSSIRRSAIFARIRLAELAHRDPAARSGRSGRCRGSCRCPAARVEGRAKEARDRQAGDRRRVLEGEEHAQPGALVGRELEDVLVLPDDLAGGDM